MHFPRSHCRTACCCCLLFRRQQCAPPVVCPPTLGSGLRAQPRAFPRMSDKAAVTAKVNAKGQEIREAKAKKEDKQAIMKMVRMRSSQP
eukprot:COSAG01_NODE_2765_length_7109_cov_131.733238_1_plen_89_part_00